jgi:Holliday junction resolvase YEN1
MTRFRAGLPTNIRLIDSPDAKRDGDNVKVYTSEAIQNTPGVSLTRGGMMLIALLSGGDYDEVCDCSPGHACYSLYMYHSKVGLAGCGASTAHALALSGFGDSLFNAAVTLSASALLAFLVPWRKGLRQELSTDSCGFLGRKYVALANTLPETFPDLAVLACYITPITSWSDGGRGQDLSDLQPRQPDVTRLAALCKQLFSWPDVPKKFHAILWEGAFFQMLCMVRRVNKPFCLTSK